MESSKKIFRITGTIKHYDWGGKTFLPQLLHMANPDDKPFAEYWLGANLDEAFGKVPYLLKVQDVEKMLSIQVHPTREVARKRFRQENEQGIPVDAPHRNYKDENHKPELLSPLSEFYLLHGFKDPALTESVLASVPELNFLAAAFKDSDYKSLYKKVMTMPQEEVNERLRPLLDRIVPLYQSGKLEKTSEDFWAARASLTFQVNNNIDRGIFSIYLFNVVKMYPGQALFQDAGLPHAYLEGHTMEIMANSDNVLRGGLTPKHIDVNELLQHVRYEPTTPNVLHAGNSATSEQVYRTPAEDFQLSRLMLNRDEGLSLPAVKTDIYFVYEGNVEVSADDQHESFRGGDAFLARPGTVTHLAAEGKATVFRAREPMVS